MYKLIEIEKGFEYKTYSFATEEKLCEHLLSGKLCVVFGLKIPNCFANKCYLFRKESTLLTYYDIFIHALDTDKSIDFICDLFEKLHSNNFMIFNFSDNQKSVINDTY